MTPRPVPQPSTAPALPDELRQVREALKAAVREAQAARQDRQTRDETRA